MHTFIHMSLNTLAYFYIHIHTHLYTLAHIVTHLNNTRMKCSQLHTCTFMCPCTNSKQNSFMHTLTNIFTHTLTRVRTYIQTFTNVYAHTSVHCPICSYFITIPLYFSKNDIEFIFKRIHVILVC